MCKDSQATVKKGSWKTRTHCSSTIESLKILTHNLLRTTFIEITSCHSYQSPVIKAFVFYGISMGNFRHQENK